MSMTASNRPIRVWIDGQCFQSASRYRGIGRAILETITFLRQNHPELDLHLSLNAAHPEEARTARGLLTPLLGADHIHVWESLVTAPESQAGYGPEQLASEAVLAHHIRSLAPDLIWTPSLFEGTFHRFVTLNDPRQIGVPSLVTFHDAIPWRFKDRYLGDPVSRAAYERTLGGLRNYDLAMAVSEFAADEWRDLFPDKPVVTVSSGLSRGFQTFVDGVASARRGVRENAHLLYVGGIDWRKNVPAIITALGMLKNDGMDRIRLRLVGDQPPGDMAGLLSLAREMKVEDWLDFTGFCSDEGLIQAYRQCDIAIQPSIMEGFGLTALEAMRAGAPLIAARAGALPEVVGDAALLFDPYNPRELADAIRTLIETPELREDFRRKGRARCDLFDWEVTAGRVAQAMAGLYRGGHTLRPSDKALRQRAASALTRRQAQAVGTKRLAAHFAAAEIPAAPQTPRLFIDVTSTYYANHGTGIQRVVTRIARHMTEQLPHAQLVICDSDVGMEAAEMTADGTLRTTRRLTRERVQPRAGDTVLLLDSSWTWHKTFKTVMRDARLRGARVISVMYDLVPVSFSAFCDDGMPLVFEKWLRAALEYSDGFMCISQATAQALHDLLEGIDFPRAVPIGWWPLGADIGPDSEATQDAGGDLMHFLSVSTIEPRKGHADTLDAFEALWADGHDLSLTIVGRPGWGTSALQERMRALAAKEPRFTWLDNASDAELAAEYSRAGTLIASSYAEGFGLPIVEGRRQGCAVIARDIDVFREIAPDGTQFFNTREALSDAILSASRRDAPLGPAPQLTSWAQSAEALAQKIQQWDLSLVYSPEDPDIFVPDSDTGPDRMAGPIPAQPERVGFSILPFTLDSPLDGHSRIAVSVTNHGEDVLFSRGRLTGEDRVNLSYLSFDHNDEIRLINAARAAIPFALGRGQTAILPLDLPDHLLANPAIKVDVAMVQEGRAWWPDRGRLDRVALDVHPAEIAAE